MLTKILSLIALCLFALYNAPGVQAVCPVCTVAVGAGLGLSRYLGIDDSVSGIWIGGLTLSMGYWFIDWLVKKKYIKNTKTNEILVIIAMYALVYVPLWFGKVIGHPENTIIGIDKIVFGSIIGSVVFLLAKWLDKKVRAVRGKQFFIYQKVIFPVAGLIIASLVVYYYGGYLY